MASASVVSSVPGVRTLAHTLAAYPTARRFLVTGSAHPAARDALRACIPHCALVSMAGQLDDRWDGWADVVVSAWGMPSSPIEPQVHKLAALVPEGGLVALVDTAEHPLLALLDDHFEALEWSMHHSPSARCEVLVYVGRRRAAVAGSAAREFAA